MKPAYFSADRASARSDRYWANADLPDPSSIFRSMRAEPKCAACGADGIEIREDGLCSDCAKDEEGVGL